MYEKSASCECPHLLIVGRMRGGWLERAKDALHGLFGSWVFDFSGEVFDVVEFATLFEGDDDGAEVLITVTGEAREGLFEFVTGVVRERVGHAGLSDGPVDEAAGIGAESECFEGCEESIVEAEEWVREFFWQIPKV